MRNMTNIRLATAALLLILPGLAFSPSLVKADGNPSASGHGTVVDGDTVRFISFNAVQHDDGTVTGQAELQNFNQEIRVHLELDCLKINGNAAVMSGIITESSNADVIGLRGVFRAQDNGEGEASSPDLATDLGGTVPGADPTCGKAQADSFTTHPVEEGNIQVRP